MNSIIILLFWLFFGITCSRIAQKKNRNRTTWFYLGVLLGIIGVIIIFFMRPIRIIKKAKEAKPVITDTNFWYFLNEDKKQVGPISLNKLIDDYKNAKIFDETLVWNETMDNWENLKNISSISNILKQPIAQI
ncbi:MAG: DUF4339 domain-containing protein [Parachlamydiales bacterium]|jgi:hypothetical protein